MARIVKLDDPKSGPARYRIRVFNGSDPRTGKKIVFTETVLGEQNAKDRAAELETMKSKGTLIAPSREPYIEYLIRWLHDVKKPELRARTWDDYRQLVARYVENPPRGTPRVGTIRMDRLQHQAFQRLYTHLGGELGLAPRTIQYLHSVLRQALSHAVRTGELARNPTDHVKLPKQAAGAEDDEAAKRYRAMSEEQARTFLEAARDDRYFALWAVLLTGGLRPGEALALTWPDTDLENSRVRVRRSLTRRGLDRGKYPKGWRLVQPKTKQARRSVVLPRVAVQALKQWKAAQARERLLLGAEYEDNGFVFCNQFGKPLHQPNLYNRNFRRIMAAAELGEWQEAQVGRTRRRFIPAFRMYDLRHTGATLLLKRGVNVKIVSERLGHSKSTLTLDTYSDVLPDMQSGAARELESVFG